MISVGVDIFDNFSGSDDRPPISEQFSKRKHTLADMSEWVMDKDAIRIWLEPTRDGAAFVGSSTPTFRQWNAHYLGGDLSIIENDALVELNPINTLVVRGKAAKTLGEVADFELNVGRDEFFSVKARHQPLYERAGEREYHAEPYTSSSAESAAEVRNEAKSVLKRRIDETTGGDMTTELFGLVRPYDRIRAKPTCSKQIPDGHSDLNPITYEVSRVHHKIRASGDSETKLNVGIHTALDDITLDGSWVDVTS